jgi:hypothetical protein
MPTSLLGAPALAAAIITLAYLVTRLGGTARPGWRLFEAVLFWHTLYWVGACVLIFTESGPTMALFVAIVSLAQLSCVAGAMVSFAYVSRTPRARGVPVMNSREMLTATAISIAAAVVCVTFITVVLRNEQLSLLLADILTGDGRFHDFRIALYSGDAVYVAPGYVRQFRDVLLPAALIALAAFGPRRAQWFALPLLLVGAFAAVLGGERIAWMLYAYAIGAAFVLRPGRKAASRTMLIAVIALAVFGAFTTITLLLGRIETDGAKTGSLLATTLAELVDRVMLTLPRENLHSFQVWGELAPSWGQSWVNDFRGVLPGVQVNFANQLADVMGMSIESGSPLGLAADTYLAWGLLGVVALPFIYVVALAFGEEVLIRRQSAFNHALRVVLFPWTFTWYSPFLFVLNGGFVFSAAVALQLLLLHE